MNKQSKDSVSNSELEKGVLLINHSGVIVGVNEFAAAILDREITAILQNKITSIIKNKEIVELEKLIDKELINLELEIAVNDTITIISQIEYFYLNNQELYEISFIRADAGDIEKKLMC